jgi:hypothetical protein
MSNGMGKSEKRVLLDLRCNTQMQLKDLVGINLSKSENTVFEIAGEA